MRKTNTLIFLLIALKQTKAGPWNSGTPFLVPFIFVFYIRQENVPQNTINHFLVNSVSEYSDFLHNRGNIATEGSPQSGLCPALIK